MTGLVEKKTMLDLLTLVVFVYLQILLDNRHVCENMKLFSELLIIATLGLWTLLLFCTPNSVGKHTPDVLHHILH